FSGSAAGIDARAAQMMRLDQRHALTTLRNLPRERVAALPRTDYEDVITGESLRHSIFLSSICSSIGGISKTARFCIPAILFFIWSRRPADSNSRTAASISRKL